MGIIGDTPQYPVVDRAPTVATVSACFPRTACRFRDA